MRRIIVLALVACGLLVWGDRTLQSVWQSEREILEANKAQLMRVVQLRAFERSLDDLNSMVEAPLTNTNEAAQTRLVLALQDQRAVLWERLEPLKEAIASDPVRLDGVESQLETLGGQVGQLVRILGNEGQVEAQKVRREVWTERFVVVRKSVRQLSDSLQKEAEKKWQATRIVQDENLKRLILGSGAIASFALLWVGFLLTRSKGRQGRMHKGIDALASAFAKQAEGDSPETRLDALLDELKTAPVGARFLSRLLASSSASGALLVDGKVQALSHGLAELLGKDARGQELPLLLQSFDLDVEAISTALNRGSGEWVNLPHANEAASPIFLRSHSLTHGSLRYVELRDERVDLMGQSSADLIISFANRYLLTATLELDGKVLSVNAAACSYLGASENDLQLAHLTDFDLGFKPDALATVVGSVQSEGRWVGELDLERASGPGLVVAQITKVRLPGEQKEVFSVIALAKDELAQARAETQTVKEELAGSETDASKAKDQLGAERQRLTTEATAAMQSFSHVLDLISAFGREMRDPLNGAAGLAELLADSGDSQRVDQLRQVTDTLINLVYCLLDHANLEAESLELHCTPISLEEIAQPVVMRYIRHMSGSDVGIELEPLDGALSQADGDITRVTQIIDALLSRSTFYALPGGVVRVRLDHDEAGRPRCRIFDAGGAVPSIAEDEIFAVASYCGAPGAARWSGVEPAVLRSLAKAMQADLSAETLETEVVWSLTLPVAESHPPRQASIPASMAVGEDDSGVEDIPPVINATVLVADDDEVNRLVATGLLERMGCVPIVVADGEEALAQLQNYLEQGGPAPVDLILLDLMMPRMDGLAATAAIRHAETERGLSDDQRIPIVAITAKASDEDQEACLGVGMNAFISKPYRHEELQGLIARFAG